MDQIGPDGKEIFGNGGTRRKIESSGQSQAMTRVGPAIFGVASARRQRADLIPGFPSIHFSAMSNIPQIATLMEIPQRKTMETSGK